MPVSRRQMMKLRHDLVGRVNDLFSRTSDILTIEVGRRTYAQNSSVKRLAWVNIIFLPMIFASGIFGMNVGPFKNYPDLAMYVAFSIPLSIFVFVTIYASRKYYAILRWIQPYTRSLHRNLATRPVDPERGVLLSPRPAPSRDASAPAADGSTTLERRLTHAIAEDARGTVQQLLPRLNLRSDRRLSDLLCNKAAAVGAKEILHLLLDNGACIDGFEASRGFPLLAATEAGREDTVKELTKRGADVWRAKPDGEDCFIVAARKGSCEILKLLLDRVKVNRESVASRLNTTVPYFFRKHELQNRRFQNWNVYQHAVSSGNLNCIKLLINRQQKIARQITPSDEKSLLMFESVYRNLNLLKYLVEESGADPDHSDKQSRNCLFHAASFLQKKVSTVGTGSDASTHVLGVMKWLAKHKERTLPVSELKKRLKPTILLLVDIHRFLNPENQQVCRQLLEWILITKSFGLNSRWMIGPCSISCLAYSVWKKDREMILWLVGRGAGTTEHDFKDTGITENDQIHYINSTEYAIATCTDTDKDEKDIEIVLALLSRSHGKIAIPTIQDGSGHIKHVLPYDFAATHGKTELAKAIADLRDGNERVPLRQAGGNDGEELEQQWWDVEAQGPSIGGPSGEESAWIGSSSASQGNTGEHTGHEAFELQPMQPSP
ncbi:ankyrin [Ascobolus immersus RN42]|uniref:Ankyrin n=1 Tax=Ascobolus immersus RN42 TaxID=1160509 RepID=A0A3N4HF20_ASCIM|nr:ankyrin [Ascobolus immersus RN42]